MKPGDDDVFPFLRELHPQEAVRHCPLVDRHSHCGASVVSLSGIEWALCTFCSLRWPVGEGLSEKPAEMDDPDMFADFIFMLAAADAPPDFNNHTGVTVQKPTKPEPGVLMFDPWGAAVALGTKPNSNPADPVAPPSAWPLLSPETRVRAAFVVMEPDPPGLNIGPWRRLRGRFMEELDHAESPSVAEAIRTYFIEDFQERLKWKTAAAEIAAPLVGIGLFDLVARKLRVGDGLESALLKQRADIDKAIARLQQLRQVAR